MTIRFLAVLSLMGPALSAKTLDFCQGWRFIRQDVPGAQAVDFNDWDWQPVVLPHTARLEQAVLTEKARQWQGICWYRKRFRLPAKAVDQAVWLRFEGAMNVAEVWVNGAPVTRHLGGFLPFVLDLTGRLHPDRDNVVAVRLDNRDNPVTGPKPLDQLDFNVYGGLYRKVALILKDRLHITDEILADQVAGGGVWVTTPEVSPDHAVLRVQTHVRNTDARPRTCQVLSQVVDTVNGRILTARSEPLSLAAGQDRHLVQTIEVPQPALWSPAHPNLTVVRVDLVEAGRVIDRESVRVGIRRIQVDEDGFAINGRRMFLRGTNRHQEYPYIGYALSDEAQARDARLIKEAGFDYVRLSHYPHSPAFMDACDELGLVVMDCLPGWQYFGDEAFARHQLENVRTMIRRDRNHPCVILWEVSLNETRMPAGFIRDSHRIAHEELPVGPCFTCGWTRGYDVFIQARQHGGCRDVTDRPCVVSEYGDWEYYAQNAGLHQDLWQDLQPDDRNSRMLRWHGERALLQQALNFQEAHNDNRKTRAFADGLWVMFDYNRGYAPDLESSGCADLMRIPKFSYHFFRSQRDVEEAGAMVFIASHWTADSSLAVRVFSNCEQVELSLNGRRIGRQGPDRDALSTHLAHPPFTFQVPAFEPGTLHAVGLRQGQVVAMHSVRTPTTGWHLDLEVALEGRDFCATGKDTVFARASWRDETGTLRVDAWENVWFACTEDLELIGVNPFASEAGISSILVQADRQRARGAVYALGLVRQGPTWLARWTGRGLNGAAVGPVSLHWTPADQTPNASSAHVTGPIETDGPIRVALVVNGRVLMVADSRSEKICLVGSVRSGEPRRLPGASTREIFDLGPSQSPR